MKKPFYLQAIEKFEKEDFQTLNEDQKNLLRVCYQQRKLEKLQKEKKVKYDKKTGRYISFDALTVVPKFFK